jgi:hypothetical protein
MGRVHREQINFGKKYQMKPAVKAKKPAVKKPAAKKGKQGAGGGRPPIVLSAEEVANIEQLAALLTKGQLSDYYGVSENTFREIEKRQPEVSEAYKKGKGRAIANVAGNLIKQAQNGNVTAAIFYLKTQAGWKESDQTVVSTTSDNIIQVVRASKPH